MFVSYSHDDTAFVDMLDSSLAGKYIHCWRDTKDLVAGPIESQLELGMESNPVVIVLSKNSVDSDWVQWEAANARRLEKRLGKHVLCPIAIDDAWKRSSWSGPLKQHIQRYNILDFAEWREANAYRGQLKKLVAGLRRFYLTDGSSAT